MTNISLPGRSKLRWLTFFLLAINVTLHGQVGVNWRNRNTTASNTTRNSLVFGGGQFVSATRQESDKVSISTNGDSWTSVSTGRGAATNCVVRMGLTFLAFGEGPQIAASTDGVTWTPSAKFAPTDSIWSAAVSDSTVVGVGKGANGVALVRTSLDGGTSWSTPLVPSSSPLFDVIKSGSTWVAVGRAGTIVTSANATVWTNRSLPNKLVSLFGVCASAKLMVAVGEDANGNGVVYTSSNSTAWTARVLPTGTFTLNDVLWTGSTFVAVGHRGCVITSPDGINWIKRNSFSFDDLNAVAWDGSQVLAVGADGGEVSSDGLPLASFGASAISVFEGGGSVRITVGLTSPAPSAFAIPITKGGGAVSGSDYSGVPASVVFGVGDLTKTFSVTLNDNTIPEPDKTMALALNAVPGMRLGVAPTELVTIVDDDSPPDVQFSEGTARVREDGGTITVNVVLSHPATTALTVPIVVATGQGKATVGSDLTGVPASVTFNEGESVKTVAINVIDDSDVEGSEDLELSFGLLAGVMAGTVSSYTLSIEDNDPESKPGRSWQLRAPFPSEDGFNAAAFSGSRMVVVGNNGLSMLSDDGGASWSKHSIGVDQSFYQVINGNNKLVAVGGGGTVAVSNDGSVWYRYELPRINGNVPNLSDIVWTGAQYVAVGTYFDDVISAGRAGIFSSPDGMVWTQRFSPTVGRSLASVAWSGSKLVAVGTDVILTSIDGVNWQDHSNAMPGVSFFNVVWAGNAGALNANDRFIAFDRSKTCYTSPDGNVWTRRKLGAVGGVSWGVWNGSKVIGVGDAIATSTNGSGSVWAEKANPVAASLWDIAYSSTKGYVALGDDHALLTSADGVTWIRRNSLPDQSSDLYLQAVAWSGRQFVAVGGDPGRLRSALAMTSPDGKAWTTRSVPVKGELTGVAWSGSVFAAVGLQGIVVTSADGVTWVNRSSPAGTLDFHGVIWAGNQFIAVGGHETGEFESAGIGACLVMTSPDGISWTRQTTPTVPPLQSIAWSGSKFVAVGRSATVGSNLKPVVLSSLDAIHWVREPSAAPNGDVLLGVTWGGGQFVAVSAGRNILRSQDGTSWTLATGVPPSLGWDTKLTGVCWTGSEYQASSVYGEVLISSDGATWTNRPTVTSQTLNGIVCNGSVEVAVGDLATIVTSGSGDVPAPTANFAIASSTVSESVGTARVLVTLSPAPTGPVSVPFTFGGSAIQAGADADYTPPSQPLIFGSGETAKYLSIPIKNDTKQEASETIVITMGAPTGAAQGTLLSHTITISDDDATLAVSAPAHKLLTIGSPLLLNVTAVGNGTLKYQWQKNKANIGGATAPYYYVAKATLANAGGYACVVTDAAGTTTSEVAQVGVVESITRSNYIPMSKDASGCVVTQAASSNCTLNWYNSSGLVVPSTSFVFNAGKSSLTIKQPSINHDTYTCKVQLAGISTAVMPEISANRWKVDIIPGVQALSPIYLPAGQIGVSYMAPMLASPAVSTWKAAGLPAGLTMDSATGIITGYPTTTANNQTVTITATNGAGSTSTTAKITITGLPTALVGTSVGLVERDPTNRGLGARVAFTVTSQGTFTGSYTVGSTATPFKGQAVLHDGGPGNISAACEATFVIADRIYTMRNRFAPNNSPSSMSNGSVAITDLAGNPVATVAHKSWPAHTAPAGYVGRYNFALRLPETSVGDQALPQGHGFGNATVSSTGAVVVAGKMGDGSVVASSSLLDVEGKALCYVPLYGAKGSFIALPKIVLGDTSIGDAAGATWSKLPDQTVASARNYPSGWAATAVKLEGSKYTAPTGPEIVMGLSYTTGATNASLVFREGGINDTPPVPDVLVNLKSTGAIDAIPLALNPRKTTLSVTPKTGEFTGTFTMVDTMVNGAALTRSVVHYGSVVRILTESPQNQGFGYYLLPQLPGNEVTPMPAPSATPILSGRVEFKH